MAFAGFINKLKGIFNKPSPENNSEPNNSNPENSSSPENQTEPVSVTIEQIGETQQPEVIESNEVQESNEPSEPLEEITETEISNQESVKEETKEESSENLQEEVEIREVKSSSSPKIIIPNQREDARKFIHIDLEKLELNKIEREAETITAYYKLLSKDVANYKDAKSDSYIFSIEKKYKMIFIHGMELKNLISALNELFYEYLINNLAEDHVAKPLLEEGQKKVIEIIGMLAKLGLYDELFNPEKSPEKYSENIDSEIHKGVFMKETEELSKYLAENINNKKSCISTNVVTIISQLKGANN